MPPHVKGKETKPGDVVPIVGVLKPPDLVAYPGKCVFARPGSLSVARTFFFKPSCKSKADPRSRLTATLDLWCIVAPLLPHDWNYGGIGRYSLFQH